MLKNNHAGCTDNPVKLLNFQNRTLTTTLERCLTARIERRRRHQNLVERPDPSVTVNLGMRLNYVLTRNEAYFRKETDPLPFLLYQRFYFLNFPGHMAAPERRVLQATTLSLN